MRRNAVRFFIAQFLLVLLLIPVLAQAQTLAGNVIYTIGTLTAVSSKGVSRNVVRGSAFYQSDTLRTAADARAQLHFTDGTLTTLSPNSQIKINHYSYVPKPQGAAKESYQYAVNLTKGGLRTVTGAIAKAQPTNFKTTTAVATLGVRGTDFAAVYGAKKGLYVGIYKGKIIISNQAGSLILDAQGPYQYAYVASQTTAPKPLTSEPSQLKSEAPAPSPKQPVPRHIVSTRDLGPGPNFFPMENTPRVTPRSTFSSGFYTGIDFGVGQTLPTIHAKNSDTFTVTVLADGDPSPSISNTLNNDGDVTFEKKIPKGGARFGYIQRLGTSPFCIAGEGYAAYAGSTLNVTKTVENSGSAPLTTAGNTVVLDSTQTSKLDFNIKFDSLEYGVSVRPGILVTPCTLLFTRVGVLTNKVTFKSRNEFSTENVASPQFAGVPAVTLSTDDISSVEKSKGVTGVAFAVGLEQAITRNLSVAIEYGHIDYKDISLEDIGDITGGAFVIDSGPPTTISLTPEPVVNGAKSNNKLSLNTNSMQFVIYWHF